MYFNKKTTRGYNSYLKLEENDGENTFMDVGLLILEPGDVYTIEERDKETAVHLICGEALVQFDDVTEISRPDPFDYAPYCLLLPKENSSPEGYKVL